MFQQCRCCATYGRCQVIGSEIFPAESRILLMEHKYPTPSLIFILCLFQFRFAPQGQERGLVRAPPQGLELEGKRKKIKNKRGGRVICASRAQHGRLTFFLLDKTYMNFQVCFIDRNDKQLLIKMYYYKLILTITIFHQICYKNTYKYGCKNLYYK